MHLKLEWLECQIPTGDLCVDFPNAVEPLEWAVV